MVDWLTNMCLDHSISFDGSVIHDRLAGAGIMFSGCPSIHLLPNLWNCYFANEQTNFNANWHSDPRGKGMKRSTLGVRRSKIKVIHGQNRSQKSLLATFVKISPTNFNQTWRAHITVNAHCLSATWMQEVKVQGHTRPQIVLEAWQRHHSRPAWVSSLSGYHCCLRQWSKRWAPRRNGHRSRNFVCIFDVSL